MSIFTGVIIQPAKCSATGTPFDSFANEARFLKCGCAVTATASVKHKLRTMVTCPTCAFQYSLEYGDMTGFYHTTLTAEDIQAQKNRCHFFRDQIRALEEKLQEVSESEPLSEDMNYAPQVGSPVLLSDDSLEITSSASDIEDEYKNTEYCVVARRLSKLIPRKNSLASKLSAQQSKPPKPANDTKDDARRLTMRTEKDRRRRERRQLVAERRTRMLAQQGAQLEENKVAQKKKVKKKADDDEPEPEPEEEGDSKKKKDPDSIEEIRALLAGPLGHFVKLTYKQRWRLKSSGWKAWKDLFAERHAHLEERLAGAVAAEQDAKGPDAKKAARNKRVLTLRAAVLKQTDAKITAAIDARLAKLEARAKHVPGRTVLTKKLAETNAEKLYLLGQFYPERLPKVEKKKNEDEDEENY